MPEFYVKRGKDGAAKGPLVIDALRSLASQKKILPTDLISGDKKKWHLAKNVQGLFSKNNSDLTEEEDEPKKKKSKSSGKSKRMSNKKKGGRPGKEKTSKRGRSRKAPQDFDNEEEDDDPFAKPKRRSNGGSGAGKLIRSLAFFLIAMVLIFFVVVILLGRSATQDTIELTLDRMEAPNSIQIGHKIDTSHFSEVNMQNVKRIDSGGYDFEAAQIIVAIGMWNGLSWFMDGEEALLEFKEITITVKDCKFVNSNNNQTITLNKGQFTVNGKILDEISKGESAELFEKFKTVKGAVTTGE